MAETELNKKESSLHSIFSGKGGALSSKRIIGTMMVLYYLVGLTYMILTKVELPEQTMEAFKVIPWVACGLLGVSVFEKK